MAADSKAVEALLKTAQDHHRRGDRNKARKLYIRILKLCPLHPIASSNLAAILIEEGSPKDALTLLMPVASNHPNWGDAIANLSACYGHLQHWKECQEASKRATRLCPSNRHSWLWLFRSSVALGDGRHAEEALKEGLQKTDPSEALSLIEAKSDTLFAKGRNAEAFRFLASAYTDSAERNKLLAKIREKSAQIDKLHAFRRILEAASTKRSDDITLKLWSAKEKLETDREDEGILELMRIVQIEPSMADAWLELGIILRRQGNLHKAEACLRRAINEDDLNFRAWCELTFCLTDQKSHRKAAQSSAKARKLFPRNEEVVHAHSIALINANKPLLAHQVATSHPNINNSASLLNCAGLALTYQSKYHEAVKTYRQGIKILRRDPGLWANRGMAHGLAGQYRSSIRCYKSAIAGDLTAAGPHVSLGMAYMAIQEFEKGLSEYEWRLKDKKSGLNASYMGRLARRGESPSKLLVISEQGLGDSIQFCRYLYSLKERLPECHLIFCCPEKLLPLFKDSLECVDELSTCESLGEKAYTCPYLPLMSIPYFCNLSLLCENTPNPYLRVNSSDSRRCHEIIRPGPHRERELIIGINWKGNPETESTNLRGRSSSLKAFSILFDKLPGATFVSLQKGAGSEELEQCSFRDRFISNQSLVSSDWSFISAAGFIQACDYVITTDTSLAHLSGALGHPTYVLLTKQPEWRWQHGNATSNWYPTTKLCRQTNHGDWSHPLEEAANQILSDWQACMPADQLQKP